MSGGDNGGWDYVIGRAEIPLCATCAQRHQQLSEAPTGAEFLFSFLRTPVIISFVAASWFAIRFFRTLVLETRGVPSRWIGLAIFGLLVATAVWSAIAAWWSTRFYRVPPQTEITRACDFSDDLGGLLGGAHRVYAIRNQAFAGAFAQANRHRVWTDADGRREGRLQMAAGVLVFLALVLAALLLPGRSE